MGSTGVERVNVKIADLARVVAPLESPRWQPCRPPMIVAATLAPASAQPPHGNATKRGRSVVTAEVVKPAKRLVAVAVAPSQPVPATVVAAAKPRACVVAVRSSACTSVATATRLTPQAAHLAVHGAGAPRVTVLGVFGLSRRSLWLWASP